MGSNPSPTLKSSGHGLRAEPLCSLLETEPKMPSGCGGDSTGSGADLTDCHATVHGVEKSQTRLRHFTSLNQSLLHGRQILYQLSYQGSPRKGSVMCNKICVRDQEFMEYLVKEFLAILQ